MVKEIAGSYKIEYHAKGKDQPPVSIDFTPPFRRIRLVPDLEAKLGVKFPDLDTEGKHTTLPIAKKKKKKKSKKY